MNSRFRVRRLVVSLMSTMLALLTVVWPDWIEEVFHISPDGGSGGLEVGLVLALIVASALSWAWTYLGWKRPRSARE